MHQQIGLTQGQEEDMNAQIAAGAKASMQNVDTEVELDNSTQLQMQQVSGQVAADNQAYFAQQESDFNASQGLRDLAVDGEYSTQAGLNQSVQNSLANLQVPQVHFSVDNGTTAGETLNAPVSSTGNNFAPGFASAPGPMGTWNPIPGLEALADRIPQWGMGALKSAVNAVVAGPPALLTRLGTQPEPNNGMLLETIDPEAYQEQQQASQYVTNQVFNALAWKPSNEGELEGYNAGNDVLMVGSLALGAYGLVDLGLGAIAGTDTLTLGEVGSSLRQSFGQLTDALPGLSPGRLGGAPLRAQLGVLDLSLSAPESASGLISTPSGAFGLDPVGPGTLVEAPALDNSTSAAFTFRGDTRSPDVIFNEGFAPRGDSTDLLAHALDNTNPPSAFVATSKSFDAATDFGNNIYVVRPVNGIDVNAVLGAKSPYPWEQEIAIPGGVAPGDIRGLTQVDQGVSILNPNWKP